MTNPDSRHFNFTHQNKSYRIHYLDWGTAELQPVICAHGLTRNAHDFDFLAHSIIDQHKVIAIDFPGRGLSDWLDDKNSYIIPTYLGVIENLLDELKISSYNWLGTSMGGLIGIILATLHSNKLNHLIINDVGPEVPSDAAARISDYLSTIQEFETITEFEHHIRDIYAPFGKLTDQQWQHLAAHSHAVNKQGKFISNYDPDIAIPFQQTANQKADLWDLWQTISVPVYLIHGENSDILIPSIIKKMKDLQPDLKSRLIKNVGHAPALMNQEQIQTIKHWLND